MTAHHSRIYLVTPEDDDDARLQKILSSIVKAGDVGALLIVARDTKKRRARAGALIKIAQDHDIAVLIDDDAHCARECGADGVHVSGNEETLTIAREVLGNNRIVGVNPGPSRHDAMEFAENSVDYVAFHDVEMARWWAPLFEVPCVSLTPASFQEAEVLAAEGVEFICPDTAMWESPEKAAEMIKNYTEVFARIDASK